MHTRRIFTIIAILIFGLLKADAKADGQSVYNLSLDEVSRLALTNNFDIQLAKYDAKIAQTDDGVARSIYDTVLEAEVQYRNNQEAKASTIVGTKTLNNDYNIGLSKKLPTGTTIDVNMTNSRSWTDSAFVTSPLTHDSSLKLTVEQELGQNFFGIQDRGSIKITKIDIENSEYTSLDKIEQSLTDVQKAYWELVLATERRNIESEMVIQAEKLFKLHQEKLKDGLVEYPEAFASQANYKTRLNELQLAENDVSTKINTLKLLLNIPEDSAIIMPTEELLIFSADEKLEDSLKKAFDNRRDYKSSLNDIKSKNIQMSMKKNKLWPEINLTASLRKNGLGDHFKQAIQAISEEDNPEVFAGIVFSFPLENTKARSELSAAELEKAKALVILKLIERKISIGIMDQVRSSNLFKELSQNNQEIVELQRKKLEEEEKRFSRGRSNTDTLIRFQEDLLTARLRAAQAKFRYQDSLIDLKQKEGVLLDKYWDAANFTL